MPTPTMFDLSNILDEHEARIASLEAQSPAVRASVSPEPRSPDSWSVINKPGYVFTDSGLGLPFSQVFEDPADLTATVALRDEEIKRLEGVVEQQRLAIAQRDARDLEDARKWRALVEKVRADD